MHAIVSLRDTFESDIEDGNVSRVHAAGEALKRWVATLGQQHALPYFEFMIPRLLSLISASGFSEEAEVFGFVPRIARHSNHWPVGLWNDSQTACGLNSVLQQLINIPQWVALMSQQPLVPPADAAVADHDSARATLTVVSLQQLLANVERARAASLAVVSPRDVLLATICRPDKDDLGIHNVSTVGDAPPLSVYACLCCRCPCRETPRMCFWTSSAICTRGCLTTQVHGPSLLLFLGATRAAIFVRPKGVHACAV